MSHRTTEWIVAGPIAGSFSLAQVNRMLAICLEQLFPGQVRVIPTYRGATEIDDIKPGKIQDTLRVLAQRKVQADQRIVILQSWPFVEPPCDAEQKVGFVFWEETRLPPRDVKHFNNVFGLILSPSEFTTNALQRSGVQIPISTVGLGWDLKKFRQIEPKNNSRTYTFLHISSCIARKGVDLLVRAYVKTFSDNEDVQLVIKGARSTDPSVRTLLDQHCGPSKKPKIIFSEHDIGEDEIVNLYADADCVVLPTRGEGFNLPAAEALAAGRPLVVTGVGGHLDFLDANSARMLRVT